MTRPVQLGRVAQVIGQSQKGLAQEEDAEARRQERHGQPEVGVVPAEADHGVEIGQERDLERHHHGGQEDDEQRPLEREVEEGESVGGGNGRDQLGHHDHRRHDEAVQEVAPEVALGQAVE